MRDLVETYGGVYFDASGVHVVSTVGDRIITSTIGAPAPARLYSFDLKGLLQHDKKVKAETLGDLTWRTAPLGRSSGTEGARGSLSGAERCVSADVAALPWYLRVSGMGAVCRVSSRAGG